MTQDFVNKVAEMRRLQKEYFKTRYPLVLREAKALEKQVDQELEKLVIKQPDQQGKLFI